MKQIYPPLIKQVPSKNDPRKASFFTSIFFLKRVILSFVIIQIQMLIFGFDVFAQEIELTGKVVNMNQEPVSNVRISLQSMPETFCYSDSIGNFTLVGENTLGIEDLITNNQSAYLLENGGLLIDVKNSSVNISIFDLMGRNLGTIVKEKNLNGKYIIYPSAYIPNLAKWIYIAHIKLGNYQKAIKFYNFNDQSSSLGLQYFSPSSTSSDLKISSNSKSDPGTEETVVFVNDFYETKHVLTTNLISDIGIVELENFGDYSIPLNMKPDKTDLYSGSGNVLNLIGKDSTEFTIHFSPYSIFQDKLTIKAIPIDELEGLAPGVELISAVHLEPGGTKFILPAIVYMDLKDITVSDSLVVFLYNDVTDKTYYIPYFIEDPFDNNSIAFSLSHFSDIGIGYQPDPEDLDEPLTSDDFITEINSHAPNLQEVPDDLFTVWFEQVVLRAIDAVYTVETLQNAMSEINLMRIYINHTGKLMEDFGFYDELISNLKIKLNYLMKDISDDCKNTEDLCTKLDILHFLSAVTSSIQVFEGLDDPVSLTDFCNGELLNIGTDFHLSKSIVHIDVSEVIQIYYIPQTQSGEALAPEEIDLEWYSLDPNIASVNQEGTITGINEGTTRVYADYCGIRHYVLVNVDNEDISYCDSHTEIYSGTVSVHKNAMENGVGFIYNATIRILANTKDRTYTGSWYTSSKHVHRRWVGGSTGYVYITSFESQSDQVHPSHRLGNLQCLSTYYALDTAAWGISLFPESNTIKSQYYMGSGTGVLTEVK